MFNERRRWKRYEVLLKLGYSESPASRKEESLTRNISRDGIRFPVNSGMSKGVLLDISIEDPFSDKSIRSKARVVWVDKFVTGDDADDIVHEVGVRLIRKKIY